MILRRKFSNGSWKTSLLSGTSIITPPVTTTPSGTTPTPTSIGNRFDVIMDQSAVAPNGTATGLIWLNGLWPATAGKTITLTSSQGATVTVALPTSGSASVPFSVPVGAAGEYSFVPSNTAGLRNPAPAPMTVFAASSGSTASLALGSLPWNYRDQRTFQQSVWAGAPRGFLGVNGATLSNGWGKLRLPLTGSAQSVFARLTDAYSAGASAAGGGTPITNVAQVYGAPASNGLTTLLLPASDYCVYVDYAPDAAFTNPTRVPLRFFIRDILLLATRSAENMLLGSYLNGIPGNTNWSSYTKTTAIGAQNPGGSVDSNGAWVRCDGVQSYGNYGMQFGGVGAQELGRVFATHKGTGLGIAGLACNGGAADNFWAADGSPCSGLRGLLDECDNEVRYLAYESDGWDGIYAPRSLAAYRQMHQAIPGKMASICPSLAVISGNAQSGSWGQNGSQNDANDIGHGRQNQCVREVEQADACVVAQDAGQDWNEYYTNSGHAAWSSAIRYARARARGLLLAEGTYAGGFGRSYTDRFTRLASTGTLSGTTATIPFQLAAGATRVNALHWQNHLTRASDWAYTAASASELRALVALYQGSGASYGTTLVPVTAVAVDNTVSPPVLKLTVPAGTATPLTLQFLTDFYRYTSEDQSSWCGFFDDRDLGDACGYGPGVREQLDVIIT